ncbi:MAG TPA: hypothetical protein VFQ72_00310 [Candidatus Paceibacterota bacterium]|nr:hypothetical protein [Candidatus Paceibacterota bacterium]
MPTYETTDLLKINVDDETKELIDRLISDREAFSEFVYTPLLEAVNELEKRKRNRGLLSYIERSLVAGVPDAFEDKSCAVMFRQIATPNYEVRRFISVADVLSDAFKPLFFEYLEDKFTDNNEWKYNLCKMSFYAGTGKKGGQKIDRVNIVDFNRFKGKRLSEITTVWGQKLGDFHREFLTQTYSHIDNTSFYDASGWFSKCGGNAKDYYVHFLRLFLQHGILFENFMLDVKEKEFTRDVFLPAFIKVMKESGYRPLIVALEPTEIEGDSFWMCHPHNTIGFVKNKSNI